MSWRGLLRIVDFQALLTAQPILAEALDKAQRVGGPRSARARALREGYNLLARVLWTRRASIPQVHDLAWLDQEVVSAGARLGKIIETPEAVRAVPGLETLFPEIGSDWIELPVDAFGGGPAKLERGAIGPFRVGLVPPSEVSEVHRAVAACRASSEEFRLLEDVDALLAAIRRAGASSAVVFAASSLEGDAAE